ncbi:hypothetical protein KGD15_004644 [Escherichia coli]|jgi:hypothetical protein|uniref:hypothetical protein n=1 Tax=unclassified Escherichia TaxID=2608889 RepID=UPI000CF77729|nr:MULTISPECIES: hypothetical protein [unclassified Escherichia]EHM2893858.1 hypothetical protein [Escherichia coli]EHM2966341.1 hypothetical protein [Escherichia coli]EHM2980516.1 hypothetical protein [Escherichia coli]EHM2998520.1 hypothetical protein [Escherichia coli]EHM3185445.1 hypothetical protein [Escherichia coli]
MFFLGTQKAELIFKSANNLMNSTLLVDWLNLQKDAINNGLKFRRPIRNNDLYIMALVYPVFLAVSKNHCGYRVFNTLSKLMTNEADFVDHTKTLSFIINYSTKNILSDPNSRDGHLCFTYTQSIVYSFVFATFDWPEDHIESIDDRQRYRKMVELFYSNTVNLFHSAIMGNQHIFKLKTD